MFVVARSKWALRPRRFCAVPGEVMNAVAAPARRPSRGRGCPGARKAAVADYYGVTEPHRAQLLALAVEANERAWWDDYADALSPDRLDSGGRGGGELTRPR